MSSLLTFTLRTWEISQLFYFTKGEKRVIYMTQRYLKTEVCGSFEEIKIRFFRFIITEDSVNLDVFSFPVSSRSVSSRFPVSLRYYRETITSVGVYQPVPIRVSENCSSAAHPLSDYFQLPRLSRSFPHYSSWSPSNILFQWFWLWICQDSNKLLLQFLSPHQEGRQPLPRRMESCRAQAFPKRERRVEEKSMHNPQERIKAGKKSCKQNEHSHHVFYV